MSAPLKSLGIDPLGSWSCWSGNNKTISLSKFELGGGLPIHRLRFKWTSQIRASCAANRQHESRKIWNMICDTLHTKLHTLATDIIMNIVKTYYGGELILCLWQSVCVWSPGQHPPLGRNQKRQDVRKKNSGKSINNPPAVAQKASHLPYKENVHVNRLSVM